MRKLLTGVAVAAVSLVAAAPAGADPRPNGNNCVGEFITLGSGPGFGQSVSQMAREGGMDDLIHLIQSNCRQ